MKRQTHRSGSISRRALMTAGTGWVIGAGGLVLPASIDETGASTGDPGGAMLVRHGHKEHNRKRHRTQKKRLRDVEVTFINDTWQVLNYNIGNDGTYLPLGLNERVTLTQSLTSFGAILNVRIHTYYALNAVNPAIGLPWVQIKESTVSGEKVVFDESLGEREEASAPGFLVKRLDDTADSKVFEVYVQDY